jgi:hypothetical protein
LFEGNGTDAEWYRTLKPKNGDIEPGTGVYEVSCQIGDTTYCSEVTVNTITCATLPSGILLQKTSYDPTNATTGTSWTDAGEEIDLLSGETIILRASYNGAGLGSIENEVLDCLYYDGGTGFIEVPNRWSYEGTAPFKNNEQLILAKSTGADSITFELMAAGTNLNYYAQVNLCVNKDQLASFTEPTITIGNGKAKYYTGEQFTISYPWVDEASRQEITVWKEPEGQYVIGYGWGRTDFPPANCQYTVNTVMGGNDSRLEAGQYSIRINLWGNGYAPASFRRNIEIISLPDFTTFEIPEETTEIGAEAFAGIAAKNVRIPDECTTIGANAFANSQLENIYIPASVTSIGDNAFPTETTVFMTQENAMAASLRTKQYTVIIIPAGIDAGK